MSRHNEEFILGDHQPQGNDRLRKIITAAVALSYLCGIPSAGVGLCSLLNELSQETYHAGRAEGALVLFAFGALTIAGTLALQLIPYRTTISPHGQGDSTPRPHGYLDTPFRR